MYDPVGLWPAQTLAEPQGPFTRGQMMMMMVTSGGYETEALGEDSPEGKTVSVAVDGDEHQQQGERYTGRHRCGPDDHADGQESAQPSV
jgi:hypothetical protein